MTTKTINGKTYTIPETWWDINLNQFLKIRDIENNVDKYDFVDYALEYISSLTNIPVETLDELPAVELGELSKTIEKIISTKINSNTQNGFEMNGKHYIFDGKTDKMILGHFIDAEMFSDIKDVWTNGHKITATFWREMDGKLSWAEKVTKKINYNKHKPEKYDSDKCLENSREFIFNVPMPYIYQTVVFFWILRKQYQAFTLRYSKKKSQMMTEKK